MGPEPATPVAPSATYRIQLTPEFGFAAAGRLAGHLRTLGITHAYLSPVLASATGSQHGYDVIDHRWIDPELGGEPGLADLITAMQEEGIGLVIDIVPNHMAMPVPEYGNQALWSVLREGAESPFAHWFDVDWVGQQSILLPVLGKRIADCLDAGEIRFDPGGGPGDQDVIRYFDHVFPVRPGTEHLSLELLLSEQHYRLAFWQVADEEVNYRRFFDVDTLVALRVEDPDVFDRSHALIVRLVREGAVQGLRIDHPDGLADPGAYVRRLRETVGPQTWIIVEKILEGDERLPTDWPVDGTTGYDALWEVGGLFVDPASGPVLRGSFAELAGAYEDWAQAQYEAKSHVVERVLATEVDRLAVLAHALCRNELRLRDFSRRGLRDALIATLVACPVYRIYVPRAGGPPDGDAIAEIGATRDAAVAATPGREAEIDLIARFALGQAGSGPLLGEFMTRFGQTTGPVMAKGVEDTAGYRWYPLASLAEVGSSPDRIGVTPEEFHERVALRQRLSPLGMTTLSTHDTKRSEDVRARLAVLSEIPGEFATALGAWQQLVGVVAADTADGSDPRMDWLIWQTLVGAWPISADRLGPYLRKAAREAKLRTSWTHPDEGYEEALEAHVHRILSDSAVVASLGQLVDRMHPAFVANVLGQKLIQLTIPGIPDTYQGCEIVSLRLVDPDNRVPPDMGTLAGAIDRATSPEIQPLQDLDAAKTRVIRAALELRRDQPSSFGRDGTYEPLLATGPAAEHVLAFTRGQQVAVITTRLTLRLASLGGLAGTSIMLPAGNWSNLLTGSAVPGGEAVELSQVVGAWPVALLRLDQPGDQDGDDHRTGHAEGGSLCQ